MVLDVAERLKALQARRGELREAIRATEEKVGGVEGPMQSWSSHEKQDLENEVWVLKQNLARLGAQIAELASLPSSPPRGEIVSVGMVVAFQLGIFRSHNK